MHAYDWHTLCVCVAADHRSLARACAHFVSRAQTDKDPGQNGHIIMTLLYESRVVTTNTEKLTYLFLTLDKTPDGQLSLDEFRPFAKVFDISDHDFLFAFVDTDSSSGISEAEFLDFFRQILCIGGSNLDELVHEEQAVLDEILQSHVDGFLSELGVFRPVLSLQGLEKAKIRVKAMCETARAQHTEAASTSHAATGAALSRIQKESSMGLGEGEFLKRAFDEQFEIFQVRFRRAHAHRPCCRITFGLIPCRSSTPLPASPATSLSGSGTEDDAAAAGKACLQGAP